ncbi:MAG TPA: anthranilate phosphoribosyltransferase [Vicinamibacteria bacterium]|nr:anthranilate phosphoribosyltransferase [Vicinamibacteria bacterium]
MNLITPLLNKAVLRPLSESDAREAALALMSGDVPPAQAGGLLSALRVRGENGGEILGFARALREHAAPFALPALGLIDTCGTGGDSLGTFNVSTLAGIVAAACGARVAKHGNRAVSSRCGSADLLEALGVKIDGAPRVAARCIDEAGFGFLFAPTYHPTLRQLAPLRRELGFRSIFNLVGPLANPARVTRQVVGVPSAAYLLPVAEALQALGLDHAFVVHGADGADEISLTGPTTLIEVRPGRLDTLMIHPEDAGLATCRPGDLAGGDAAENAAIANRILGGERGHAHDFVVINAAAALVVAGRAGSLREGAVQAREALLSRRARSVLDTVRRVSQEAA